MTTRNKTVFAATGLAVATSALLFGVTSAQAANTTPAPSSTAATECRGPAASLSAEQCASFQTDMKAARDGVFTKSGLTPPTGDGPQRGGHKGGGQGPDLSSLTADQKAAFTTDMEAVHTQRDAVLAKYGTIDILVNNAGASWSAPAEDHPTDAWNKIMNLNINAMFLLSREVGKRVMIPKRAGKIINIASIAGLAGGPPDMTTIAYTTSKGAAVNFTRGLASEWGKYNINVNAICPGFFRSKMSQVLLERIEEKIIEATPLHRLGGEEDLMGTVVFLASEAARHITGQYIAVDGGGCIAS